MSRKNKINKVYLFSDAGVSSSVMVNKMMQIVYDHNFPFEIEEFPISMAFDKIKEVKPVAILLTPQVKFLTPKMKKLVEPMAVPVTVLNRKVYSSLDAQKAMKALLLSLKAQAE